MEELATTIQSLDGHPTKEEVQHMTSEVEVNGNGTIDFQEFLNIMGRKMKVKFYICSCHSCTNELISY